MLAGLHLGGVAPRKVVVHLGGHSLRLLPQLGGQGHPFAAAGLCIEKSAPWDFADQHFFQRHGLGAELQTVGVVCLGGTVLVLHRQRQPQPGIVLEGHPFGAGAKFHHIADAGQLQPVADHPQSPYSQ